MTLGLIGLGLVVLCGIAFVVSVVRADARVHREDPAALSGLRGWPLVWLLGAGASATLFGVRVAGVLGGWWT